MNREEILSVLSGIIHPETGRSITEEGMVETVAAERDRLAVTLVFPRTRDPFMQSIRKQVIRQLETHYPQYAGKTTVTVREGVQAKAPAAAPKSSATEIGQVVAVASGKGGVGKSTVTANLALTLRNKGYRVGILDADIYGPSQPRMFGLEGYRPEGVEQDGSDRILPAEAFGIKIMSIGFFINPDDALLWRGPMATNALRQMIHQTLWGTLDYLLIDLPPGTGDVHLSVISELKVSGAVIVSTPQQVATSDVIRGIEMFRAPQIDIPMLGVIENMAWFTPAELPENRYYLFGKGGAKRMAQDKEVDFLGEIPIIQSIMEGAEEGHPSAGTDQAVEKFYRQIADKIVQKTVR